MQTEIYHITEEEAQAFQGSSIAIRKKEYQLVSTDKFLIPSGQHCITIIRGPAVLNISIFFRDPAVLRIPLNSYVIWTKKTIHSIPHSHL
ncbi:hypothetical protein BNJ_00451 [Kaumoebavirus]|uniref:hypothetical protein n=1 Tax=Kaumoebavirus TaxID=1859492 RepID=UPI0009C38959|nr:hypothetical protein BNJ_00451 [Kaumoebavirus]ARA72263.1 hypothetical protein BNJ_00451 [Kaumoebavirus]